MKTNEPYEVMDELGWIVCCAWCFPDRSIEKLFPDLAGVEISHGICPRCLEKYMQKLGQMQDKAAHNQDIAES